MLGSMLAMAIFMAGLMNDGGTRECPYIHVPMALKQVWACREFNLFHMAHALLPSLENAIGDAPEGVYGFELSQLSDDTARRGRSDWRAILDDPSVANDHKVDLLYSILEVLQEDGEIATMIEGEAWDAKAGAVVVGSDGLAWYIEGLEAWPRPLRGCCVTVVGVVAWGPPNLINVDVDGCREGGRRDTALTLRSAEWSHSDERSAGR